jgi:curved DNA-binding protein CbpA
MTAGGSGDGRMTRDPFVVLSLDENAGDDAIKQRYLALVRAFPPDREPDRFQEIRQAYETVRDERGRLELKLLHTGTAALTRLKLHCLAAAGAGRHPASATTVTALILDSLSSPLPLAGEVATRSVPGEGAAAPKPSPGSLSEPTSLANGRGVP